VCDTNKSSQQLGNEHRKIARTRSQTRELARRLGITVQELLERQQAEWLQRVLMENVGQQPDQGDPPLGDNRDPLNVGQNDQNQDNQANDQDAAQHGEPNPAPNQNADPNVVPNIDPNAAQNVDPNIDPNAAPNINLNVAPNAVPNIDPNAAPNININAAPNQVPAPQVNQQPGIAQAYQQAAANLAAAQAALNLLAAQNLGVQPPPPIPPVPQMPFPMQVVLPPPHVGIPQPPVPFALFPGRAASTYLDLRSSAADIKLYNKSIEGLPNKYDLSPIGLNQFLSSVMGRVTAYGWEGTIRIPDLTGIIRNLIMEYGLVTATDCLRYILSYFNLSTREAQNSVMMFQFLMNSLTLEAQTEMCVYKDQYIIEYTPTPGDPSIEIGSGACLLKAIIGKAVLDTMASVNTLRAAIRNLDKKFVEMQSNVKQFNMYVAQQRTGLTARGEAVPELLMSLFEAYLRASDEDFVQYIKIRQYSHIDQTNPLTPDALMALALAQYEYYLDQGVWNAPTKKDKKIIALTAEVNKLRKGSNNASDQPPAKRQRKNDDKYAWKKEKPKGNEKTKVVGKKSYHWCKWHQAWTIHDPSKCTLSHKKNDKTPSEPDEKEGKVKALQVDPVLQAVADDDSEEEYEYN
jgi:hypothetical protein